MISKFGSVINSIYESDIKTPNKLPPEAKPTQFWSRTLELTKFIFNNSSALVDEILTKVKAVTQNGDSEVLITALKQHMEKIYKETFLDSNCENPVLPE